MKKLLLSLSFITIILLGCENEGLDGKNSLIDMTIENAGENCSNEGIKIVSGIDLNGNNVLEENEIQETEYICNGNNASLDFSSYVVKLSQSGTNVPSGIVIKNDLSLTITWVRESSGSYLGTFDMPLDLTKTIATATPPPSIRNVYLQFVNDNSIRVKTEPYNNIYQFTDTWNDLILEIKTFN
ncbi:DUF7151 family protein [Aquimarina macrocephali]|uniref:DUF7151 family protein n=1 Tax=Aquimarina macrocephali TaxID=666563 RepID=UPI003F681CBF